MQAQRANSRPAPLNADVTNLDVPLADARLALAAFALDAFRAKVVRLKFHFRSGSKNPSFPLQGIGFWYKVGLASTKP